MANASDFQVENHIELKDRLLAVSEHNDNSIFKGLAALVSH